MRRHRPLLPSQLPSSSEEESISSSLISTTTTEGAVVAGIAATTTFNYPSHSQTRRSRRRRRQVVGSHIQDGYDDVTSCSSSSYSSSRRILDVVVSAAVAGAAATVSSSSMMSMMMTAAILLLTSPLPLVHGLVSCETDNDCQTLLESRPWLGGNSTGSYVNSYSKEHMINPSRCINGKCTNPYQNGCLINRLEGWTEVRMCNSDDDLPTAAELGICRIATSSGNANAINANDVIDSIIEYMEIRIGSQNWESVFFESWILQILLSEVLDVPTSIETGYPDKNVNLYDEYSRFDYGSSNLWNGLQTATEIGDCRLVNKKSKKKVGETDTAVTDTDGQDKSEEDEITYQPCCHIIPEVWSGHEATVLELEELGVIEPHTFIGVVGFETWFVPRFTGERDPSLLSYLGLQGEANRHKLASTFLQPTTWEEYCTLVSKDNCTTPDETAIRAPRTTEEKGRYHVKTGGAFKGYFRNTTENDCETFPNNCTGHIADYPCGWTSYVKPITHHLNIALKSSGKEPGSNGYSYGQLVELWEAANATKSDFIMQWWIPEALYELFIGTEAEFQIVNLPPANYECFEHRVNTELTRCPAPNSGITFKDQVGSPLGACGDAPLPVMKVVSNGLYEETYNRDIPKARESPAYEAIANFRIDGTQLSQIFDYWLQADFDKWNFDPRDAACRWVVEHFDEVQRFVPRTYPRVLKENTLSRYNALAYTATVFGGLATLSVIIAAIATYKERNQKAIEYAQVEFLYLLLGGLLLVSVSSILQSVKPTNARCISVIWLINLGYCLELVPLIVKVAAMNKLMNAARRYRRIKLKRSQLFGAVACLSLLAVVFLTIWTILDAPRHDTFYTLTDTITSEGDTVVLMDYYCKSGRFVGWKFISIGGQICLLICCTVLAYQNRKLRKDVNESQTLAIMIYSHFVNVTGRSLLYIFEGYLGVVLTTQLFSMLYSFDVFGTLFFYFVPKFLAGDSDVAVIRFTIPKNNNMPFFFRRSDPREDDGDGGGYLDSTRPPNRISSNRISSILTIARNHPNRFPSMVSTRSEYDGPRRTTSLMPGENGAPRGSLNEDCTVLFGTIDGFMQWSSGQDPPDVFYVLEAFHERIFGVAKKYTVVVTLETNGGFFAVTGLQQEAESHAGLMAVFARECLASTAVLVTRELPARLGDTTMLSLRLGMHSGPVTAGGLNDSPSQQFQLVGNTVTMATQIEQTGARGRLHISEVAADLLEKAGKGAWLEGRSDAVGFGDKGETKTFWLL